MNPINRSAQTTRAIPVPTLHSSALRAMKTQDFYLVLAVVAFYLEGSIRKWVLPEHSPWMEPVALSKAVFIGLAVLFSTRTSLGTPLDYFRSHIVGLPFVMISLGACISAFTRVHVLGAILTLVSLLGVPYIATWVPRALSRRGLHHALIAASAIMIMMVPLVIAQYMSDRTDFINCYVGGDNHGVSTTGFNNRVRATGTFSYITGLSIGSLIGEAAAIFMYMTTNSSRIKAFAMIAIASSAVCGLATVSRGSLLANTGLLFGWAYFARGMQPKIVVAMSLAFFWLIVVQGSGGASQVIQAVFVRSSVVSDSYFDRIVGLFADFVTQLNRVPLGGGLGRSQNVSGGFYNAGVETELGRIVFEVGAVGFIGYLFVFWGAAIWLLRTSWQCHNHLARTIGIVSSVCCTLLLLIGVVFNHVSLMAFWASFTAGAWVIDNDPKFKLGNRV